MRIRRNASRLLRTTFPAAPAPAPDAAAPFELPVPAPPPPPPHMEPYACEFNRSPWDLLVELNLPDPQVEDDILDMYFVNVSSRSGWLLPDIKPSASVKVKRELVAAAGGSVRPPWREAAKKVPKRVTVCKEKGKESEMKQAKVMKEEDKKGKAPTWDCKKNDGRGWYCPRKAGHPNSLCDYHFFKKHPHLDPEFTEEATTTEALALPVAAPAPKTSTSSKPQKKKKPVVVKKKKKPNHDSAANEGCYYYYSGFGPIRGKRSCRSTMHNSVPTPPKQQDVDESMLEDAAAPKNQTDKDVESKRVSAGHHDNVFICDDIVGIADSNENSGDDDYVYKLSTPGCNMDGDNKHRRGVNNGDNKRKKLMKERSLKSLM